MARRSPLDPALKRQLAAEAGPFQVIVTFKTAPAAAALGALGLYGSGSDDRIGYGVLDAAAVRALAQRRDVAGISAAEVLPARPEPPGVARGSPKIEPLLASRLLAEPGELQRVAVTFEPPPGSEAVAALGLSDTGGGLAVGLADAAAIETLAARSDVVRITWRPEPQLSYR